MAKEPERSLGAEDQQRLNNSVGGQAIHPEDYRKPAPPPDATISTSADLTTGRGQDGNATGQDGSSQAAPTRPD
jgi:hypothetical protein